MLTIRRLLFATDHSPCADRAYAHATFLARHLGAELHVFHVAPVTGGEGDATSRYPAPEGVTQVDVTRRASSAAVAIVEAAREADLVVMGTHGRRGVSRVTLGSTAEQVMRGADCPVLAVGLDAAHADPASVTRLLVPVDVSDASAPALALADALAALYEARVDILHAVFVPDLPAVYGLSLQGPPPYPDIVARTRRALDAMLARHVAPERRGRTVVPVGPPGPTILDEAERLGSGMLVMPTRGRTGLARLAFGSVAETVLRRAPCAVLALPAAGRLPLAGVDLTDADAPASSPSSPFASRP